MPAAVIRGRYCCQLVAPVPTLEVLTVVEGSALLMFPQASTASTLKV
jgi:hypothetical protein